MLTPRIKALVSSVSPRAPRRDGLVPDSSRPLPPPRQQRKVETEHRLFARQGARVPIQLCAIALALTVEETLDVGAAVRGDLVVHDPAPVLGVDEGAIDHQVETDAVEDRGHAVLVAPVALG